MLLVLVVLVDEDDDDAADNASALIWSLHHGECVIVVGCRSYCTLALLLVDHGRIRLAGDWGRGHRLGHNMSCLDIWMTIKVNPIY